MGYVHQTASSPPTGRPVTCVIIERHDDDHDHDHDHDHDDDDHDHDHDDDDDDDADDCDDDDDKAECFLQYAPAEVVV